LTNKGSRFMRIALNFQRVDPSKGGAETYVADLCHRLVRAGHAVDLYAESWRDDALPEAVRRLAVAAPGRTRIGRLLAFAKNSEKALREAEADLDCSVGFINTWYHDVIIPQGGVHGGSLQANAQRHPEGWRRSLYLLGKQINPKHWAYRHIERKQYDPDRGPRVVAVSQMVMGHLQRYHHVPRSHIRVIPNAIDPDRLAVAQPGALRCAFRNELGLRPDELTGLFVGHNFWLKGLKPLLEALAARRSEGGRAVHLVVCGGGRLGPFRRLTRRLGLEREVHLLGFHPDIRACYHGCDFLVSPTYYDPCSLVVFEALTCGLPVITTACNGAGELITDGREGYVITAPDAIGELATAIDHMAVDDARAEMARQAAALGRAQSMDRHGARLIELFEEVAASKSRRGPHLRRLGTAPRRDRASR
jgi:UDP-glucose:(heptosyl)LPS alpha-1,3-glucosyltransferase